MIYKRKKKTILLILFIAFIILVVASPFMIVKWYVEPMIIKKLDQFSEQSTSPYYQFSYEEVDINIFKGSVFIQGCSLLPKSDPKSMIEELNLPFLIGMSNTTLEIKGISLLAYIKKGMVILKRFRIEDPEVTFYGNADHKPETSEPVKEAEAQSIFSNYFKGIKIDDFQLVNGNLDLVRMPDDTSYFEIDSINISISNIRFDSTTFNSKIVRATFKDFYLKSKGIQYALSDNYSIKTAGFRIDGWVDHEATTKQSCFNFTLIKPQLIPADEKVKSLAKSHIRSLTAFNAETYTYFGLDIKALVRKHKMIFDSMVFFKPVVIHYLNPTPKKNLQRNPIRQQIIKHVDSVAFSKFLLDEGSFTMIKGDEKLISLQGIRMTVEEGLITDSTLQTPFGFGYKEANIIAKKIVTKESKFYDININGYYSSLKNKSIYIKEIQVNPKYTKDEFSNLIEYKTDLFRINIMDLSVAGIDFEKIDKENGLFFESIDVGKLLLYIYKDKRLPDPPFKVKDLTATALKKLDFPLYIGNINVKDADITYEEKGDILDTDSTGIMDFVDANVQLKNLTNIPGYIKLNPHLTLDVKTKTLGYGNTSISLMMDLSRDDDYMEISGYMDTLPAIQLNKMLYGLLFCEIPEGIIYRMDFNIQANNDLATGNLELEYENLKITILKKTKPEKEVSFMNFLTNTALKSNNLKSNKSYKIGKIYAYRKLDKGIVSFFWNSVKTGLLSVMVPFYDPEKSEEKTMRKKKKKDKTR